MKKSSVLAAVLVLSFASAVMAAETTAVAPLDLNLPATAEAGCCACPADPTVTGDVYIGPVSKYLFRGNDLSTTGDFVMQGGIDIYYKAFTLSYWGNGQNRYSDGAYNRFKVNETDFIIDYAVPYTIPYLDNLKFNVGTVYYAVDAIDDTNEFYLKAAYDTLLKPTFTVYWDNMLATKAGLFYSGAISHKINIERNLFAANVGALVSYNQRNPSAAYSNIVTEISNGDGVYSGWHNYELTASLDYTPTAHITITPSYMFSNGLSSGAKDLVGIRPQNAYGIKAMFTF
ncbi:MAG: hypothetical protein ACOYL3_02290 [Desulfuromonadaceae bacterium]